MSQATITAGPYRNSDLFSGYYLEERIDDLDAWDCDAEAEAVFEELQALWKNEGDLVAGSNEDTLLGSWIDPVLDALGYDMLQETPLPETGGFIDRVLYGDAADRRDAMGMKQDGQLESALSRSSVLLEAKQWDTDFAQRFSEQRSYRDASHQVKYYLEHTPESLQWGILTDGKKWRLYGTKDYATETYYEVDLPELLAQDDLDAFKYFYLFFRPEAFREIAGTSFLETVWSESETAAQELGEDLQDNVFTALRVLGEGFVESNDLGIDPAREELKEQSLVLLYRLMFVFYAESRGLIHPDDPGAEDDYRENFSLEELRDDVVDRIGEGETFEDFSEYSTQMWNRLQRLFGLIDTGEEALGIPAYNGGLFDNDDHAFLTEHDVADRYVAEVVYQLGTTENEKGEDVTADYADLDTRHLGTIYEGLLEHEFRIADEQYAAVAEDGGQVWKPATEVSAAEFVEIVEEGELYVVNDDGERKATGAYYTPDYVVSYIVEETVDPLLDEIHEELKADGLDQSDEAYFGRFYGAVQDLTILDPAMGSGHFLTKATGYLTEQVMEVVREQERMGRDEQQLRRTISRECIYGVDINGMATELAKLSMWLETLAQDQPLAFLDHHLKAGNSLVGSDITEVLATSASTGTEQATLFDDFSRTRRQALEHVMGLLEDLLDIENETVADAKAMQELYEEIRSDDLYERLFGIANVHTAERFGLDLPAERDVYKEMADAIDDDAWAEIEGRDWYTTAQATAAEEGFFHWELEYPEVFFSEEGERGEDAGFDAVVGNPPYVRIQRIHERLTGYLFEEYESCASRTDLSLPFIEKAIDLLNPSGHGAYISTSQWLSTEYGRAARGYLSSGYIRKMLDFNTLPVFEGVSTYPTVFHMVSDPVKTLKYGELSEERQLDASEIANVSFRDTSYEQLSTESWVFDRLDLRTTLNKAETIELGELGHFHIGAITGMDDAFTVSEEEISDEELEEELIHPYAHHNDEIHRFDTVSPKDELIYPYHDDSGETKLIPEKMLKSEYPNIHEHLRKHRGELEQRKDSRKLYADGEDWYRFLRPGRFEYVYAEKLLFRGLAKRTHVGWLDRGTVFSGNNCPGFISDDSQYRDEYLVAILNSSLISEYLVQISPDKMQDYSRFNASDLNETPVRSIDFDETNATEDRAATTFQRYEEMVASSPIQPLWPTLKEEADMESLEFHHDLLCLVVQKMRNFVSSRSHLNLALLDHLGSYGDGETLADIGFTQPPENAADSILQETTEQKPNLRVGNAEVVRESSTTVEIRLTARYKPDDKDGHETDQWGYTETDLLPALRITDLTDTEADLIEAFVPVAVDEAGGFADFRETATKTNSLVDRLRALTLPRVDDVADGLKQYRETKERADELDEKIQRTDNLIDEIVYELYGLTDAEIEIVEQSVQ